MRRIRPDDERSDELLEATGRRAFDLELAISWTSGIVGEKAKAASDRGAFAWKKATKLPDREFAAGLYVQRCRTRNPVVVAGASGLVLLEVDGDLELLERFGLALPETVRVASKRGVHFYLGPPRGRPPLKVQVSPEGVVTSSDGYLVAAGALHPEGPVYRYLAPGEAIAELAVETYDRLLELGGEVRENVRRSLAAGERLVEGLRRDTLFSLALELAHRGLDEDLVAYCLLEVDRRVCDPPVGERAVREQARGAVVRARRRPSAEHELRQRALEILGGLDDRVPEVNEPRLPGRPRSKAPEALELVREMLANGPRRSAEVKAEGRRRGMSERTVERAARELGVLTETGGDTRRGKGGRIAYWHRSEFCRDLDFARAESGIEKVGTDKPEPLPSVGSSRGRVTPLPIAPRVLSRPTPEEVDSDDSEPVDFDPFADVVCDHPEAWLARDGRYRCTACEPAHFPGEVVAIYRGRS